MVVQVLMKQYLGIRHTKSRRIFTMTLSLQVELRPDEFRVLFCLQPLKVLSFFTLGRGGQPHANPFITHFVPILQSSPSVPKLGMCHTLRRTCSGWCKGEERILS